MTISVEGTCLGPHELSSRPERSAVEGPAVSVPLATASGPNRPRGWALSRHRRPCPQALRGSHRSTRVPHVRTSVARISYYAALATTANAAFSQRKPHEVAQRHQPRQEVRDTWAENVGRSPSKLCPLSFPNQPTNPFPAVYKPAANTYAPR